MWLPASCFLSPLKRPALVLVCRGALLHLDVCASLIGAVGRDAGVGERVVDAAILQCSKHSHPTGAQGMACRCSTCVHYNMLPLAYVRTYAMCVGVWDRGGRDTHVSELPDDGERPGESVTRAVPHPHVGLALQHLSTQLCHRVEADLLL